MRKENFFDMRIMQPDIDESRANELKHLHKIKKNREFFVAGVNWFRSGMNLEDSELSSEICFVRGFEKAKSEYEKKNYTTENRKSR